MILFVLGCTSFKLTPALDTSLSPTGEVTARKTMLILPTDSTNRISVPRKVSEKFSKSSEQKLAILSAKRKHPYAGKGFQCIHPFLYVITIGIIPAVCTQEYTFEIEWQYENGRIHKKEIVVSEKTISGWAALFVTILSDWHFGSYGAINSVIYTEVNLQNNSTLVPNL